MFLVFDCITLNALRPRSFGAKRKMLAIVHPETSRLGQENVNFVKKAMLQMLLAYGGCTWGLARTQTLQYKLFLSLLMNLFILHSLHKEKLFFLLLNMQKA